MMEWKRPQNIPYPSIWVRFTAKDADSDELVSYVVQDLPEDSFDDAMKHRFEVFAYDEPLCSGKELYNDEEALSVVRISWRNYLEQKCSLVCFKENSKEIVGLNILSVASKTDKENRAVCNSQRWNDARGVLTYFSNKLNVFEYYGVETYLNGLGLSVTPKYRERGVATQLLAARIPMCKAFGVNVTSTIFTSTVSQVVAEKNGYETNYEESYKELAEKGKHMSFPDMALASIKVMSRKI